MRIARKVCGFYGAKRVETVVHKKMLFALLQGTALALVGFTPRDGPLPVSGSIKSVNSRALNADWMGCVVIRC